MILTYPIDADNLKSAHNIDSGLNDYQGTLHVNKSIIMSKQYGVTESICIRNSSTDDEKLTEELQETLQSFGYFETQEEWDLRMDVLRRINFIVKKWVRNVSIMKNLPPEIVEKAGGKLYTFGSFRLGVHTRGADIDSLCIAPRYIERSDFFSSFYELLKNDSNVTELHAVEDAFVPVMKLKYNGIELDILFAQLSLTEINDYQKLDDDELLRNLDEKSIRSLNGCRVADEILKAIPNTNTFTVALRAVKLWAKNHSIYSNSLGFLGGVSWAILVARICQLYPNASPAVIVEKLFLVFSTWEWPHPVFLKDSDSNPRPDIPNLNELVWDPRQRTSDRYHLMPIITPAYPEQNSTFNVTKSTRTILTNEFKNGLQTMIDIISKKKTWRHLFDKVNFFSKYKHYICLVCSTECVEDHLIFSSLVESKLRHLITFLERNQYVNLCHVNPERFKPNSECDLNLSNVYNIIEPEITLWFIGLEPSKHSRRTVDISFELQQFSELVVKSAQCAGIYKPTMIIKPFYVKERDLDRWINNYYTSQSPQILEARQQVKYAAEVEELLSKISQMNQPSFSFCSKHSIRLPSLTMDLSNVSNLEKEVVHSFLPVNACVSSRKNSTNSKKKQIINCDCEENSYYCCRMKVFLKNMKESNPLLDFAQMTRNYLSSLEVCRTAIDAEELVRADAEKTLDYRYIPSKRPHFNIESIVQWSQRMKTGPHPSVFAFDYTDGFGTALSFLVESSKPNEQLSLPNLYRNLQLNGGQLEPRIHNHHFHKKHVNHQQTQTIQTQNQQQQYFFSQQIFYMPLETVHPRLSYSSVVTGGTPTPTGSKLSEDDKTPSLQDENNHFIFNDENVIPLDDKQIDISPIEEVNEEKNETPPKVLLYADVVAKTVSPNQQKLDITNVKSEKETQTPTSPIIKEMC